MSRFTKVPFVAALGLAGMLAACDSSNPGIVAGGGGGHGGTQGAPTTAECLHNAPGCACANEGAVIRCGEVADAGVDDAGDIKCATGGQICTLGKWSQCDINSNDPALQSGTLTVKNGVKLQGLSPGQACTANPCDPYCMAYPDNAADAAVADTGLSLLGCGDGSTLTVGTAGNADATTAPTAVIKDAGLADGEDVIYIVLPTGQETQRTFLTPKANIKNADIYFLIDDTSSMGPAATNLANALTSGTSSIIAGIKTSLPTSTYFGAGRFEDYFQAPYVGTYAFTPSSSGCGGSPTTGLGCANWYNLPFQNLLSLQSDSAAGACSSTLGCTAAAVNWLTIDAFGALNSTNYARSGGDIPEASVTALWQMASGQGLIAWGGATSTTGPLTLPISGGAPDQAWWLLPRDLQGQGFWKGSVMGSDGTSTVENNNVWPNPADDPAMSGFVAPCPAGTVASSYPCFRQGSTPVIVMLSDAPSHEGPSGQYPHVDEDYTRFGSGPNPHLVGANTWPVQPVAEGSPAWIGDPTATYAGGCPLGATATATGNAGDPCVLTTTPNTQGVSFGTAIPLPTDTKGNLVPGVYWGEATSTARNSALALDWWSASGVGSESVMPAAMQLPASGVNTMIFTPGFPQRRALRDCSSTDNNDECTPSLANPAAATICFNNTTSGSTPSSGSESPGNSTYTVAPTNVAPGKSQASKAPLLTQTLTAPYTPANEPLQPPATPTVTSLAAASTDTSQPLSSAMFTTTAGFGSEPAASYNAATQSSFGPTSGYPYLNITSTPVTVGTVTLAPGEGLENVKMCIVAGSQGFTASLTLTVTLDGSTYNAGPVSANSSSTLTSCAVFANIAAVYNGSTANAVATVSISGSVSGTVGVSGTVSSQGPSYQTATVNAGACATQVSYPNGASSETSATASCGVCSAGYTYNGTGPCTEQVCSGTYPTAGTGAMASVCYANCPTSGGDTGTLATATGICTYSTCPGTTGSSGKITTGSGLTSQTTCYACATGSWSSGTPNACTLSCAQASAASTAITAASNGVAVTNATLNVGSTSGFPATGKLTVASSSGNQTITYTGMTATSFTGCSGGTTGTWATGGSVVTIDSTYTNQSGSTCYAACAAGSTFSAGVCTYTCAAEWGTPTDYSQYTKGTGTNTATNCYSCPLNSTLNQTNATANQPECDYCPGGTASTTIAAASNNVALPTGTIHVASTTGFRGGDEEITVTIGGVGQTVICTGTSATTFTGCTGGTGTMATGDAVSGEAATTVQGPDLDTSSGGASGSGGTGWQCDACTAPATIAASGATYTCSTSATCQAGFTLSGGTTCTSAGPNTGGNTGTCCLTGDTGGVGCGELHTLGATLGNCAAVAPGSGNLSNTDQPYTSSTTVTLGAGTVYNLGSNVPDQGGGSGDYPGDCICNESITTTTTAQTPTNAVCPPGYSAVSMNGDVALCPLGNCCSTATNSDDLSSGGPVVGYGGGSCTLANMAVGGTAACNAFNAPGGGIVCVQNTTPVASCMNIATPVGDGYFGNDTVYQFTVPAGSGVGSRYYYHFALLRGGPDTSAHTGGWLTGGAPQTSGSPSTNTVATNTPPVAPQPFLYIKPGPGAEVNYPTVTDYSYPYSIPSNAQAGDGALFGLTGNPNGPVFDCNISALTSMGLGTSNWANSNPAYSDYVISELDGYIPAGPASATYYLVVDNAAPTAFTLTAPPAYQYWLQIGGFDDSGATATGPGGNTTVYTQPSYTQMIAELNSIQAKFVGVENSGLSCFQNVTQTVAGSSIDFATVSQANAQFETRDYMEKIAYDTGSYDPSTGRPFVVPVRRDGSSCNLPCIQGTTAANCDTYCASNLTIPANLPSGTTAVWDSSLQQCTFSCTSSATCPMNTPTCTTGNSPNYCSSACAGGIAGLSCAVAAAVGSLTDNAKQNIYLRPIATSAGSMYVAPGATCTAPTDGPVLNPNGGCSGATPYCYGAQGANGGTCTTTCTTGAQCTSGMCVASNIPGDTNSYCIDPSVFVVAVESDSTSGASGSQAVCGLQPNSICCNSGICGSTTTCPAALPSCLTTGYCGVADTGVDTVTPQPAYYNRPPIITNPVSELNDGMFNECSPGAQVVFKVTFTMPFQRGGATQQYEFDLGIYFGQSLAGRTRVILENPGLEVANYYRYYSAQTACGPNGNGSHVVWGNFSYNALCPSDGANDFSQIRFCATATSSEAGLTPEPSPVDDTNFQSEGGSLGGGCGPGEVLLGVATANQDPSVASMTSPGYPSGGTVNTCPATGNPGMGYACAPTNANASTPASAWTTCNAIVAASQSPADLAAATTACNAATTATVAGWTVGKCTWAQQLGFNVGTTLQNTNGAGGMASDEYLRIRMEFDPSTPGDVVAPWLYSWNLDVDCVPSE